MINECSICLEELSNNFLILNCKHKYHIKCYTDWRNRISNDVCPDCNLEREIVDIIDKTHNNNNIGCEQLTIRDEIPKFNTEKKKQKLKNIKSNEYTCRKNRCSRCIIL